jgi:hypothetical protein
MGLPADYYVKMDRDYAGGVTYAHKVRGGKDIYLFVNTTDTPMSTIVTVRGSKPSLEYWDPHTGERVPVDTTIKTEGSISTTSFSLSLDKLHGMFVVGE